MEHLREASWGVVSLEISLPDTNGLTTLRRLAQLKRVARECAHTPVLIVSDLPEEQFAEPALKAGAAGFVSKSADTKTLMIAFQKVIKGERYISPLLAERLAAKLAGEVTDLPHETLSEREFQVFRLIASGKQSSRIATELCLSPKTVQTYRARILDKMRIKSNAELAQYAYAHKLLH